MERRTNYTCEELFDMGIKFHHYTNTAYPLRVNSLAEYELHDVETIHQVVAKNIDAKGDKSIRAYSLL